jgi:hypothetical protein
MPIIILSSVSVFTEVFEGRKAYIQELVKIYANSWAVELCATMSSNMSVLLAL